MTINTDLKEPIIGWLYLYNESISPVSAMLRDVGNRIELSVPFRDMNSLPGCWFRSGAICEHLESEYQKIPKTMRFVRNNEIYVLVGCRVASMTAGMLEGIGPGTGVVVPTHVVCGAYSGQYEMINGLRTSCKDIVQWFGLKSIEYELGSDEDGRCKSVDVRSKRRESLIVSGGISSSGMSLIIRPSFTVSPNLAKDTITSHQKVYVETCSRIPLDWEEHIDVHSAITELLSIADWNSRVYTDMLAMRDDDPVRVESGTRIDDRWAPVVSYRPVIDRSDVGNYGSDFLFKYSDIGNGGIKKWLLLRNECSQGMSLMAYIAREQQHLSVETLSMLVGTALECVAWYIATRENDRHLFQKNKEGKMLRFNSYESALTCIVEKFGNYFPFEDSNLWRKKARIAFMGNKHPDAYDADFQTMYETTMQSLLILRIWIGIQLGASVEKMSLGLRLDEIGKNIYKLIR